ncbi:MAG TPA: YCF48-related protein, partial [Chitinophagaceae bacterium]|nr:YCF48-related protein [Chitinophagaceae bacterium]
MKNILLPFIITIFSISNSVAQWTRINAIPSQRIHALTLFGDTILAASDTNLIYRSVDGGVNWDSLLVSNNSVAVISLNVIDNKIYVGTAHAGIFSSSDFGATWQNTGSTLFAVAEIKKHDTDLYAATLGNGVYIFNQASGSWIPFNDSLPSYSVNVFTMTSTPNSLLIGPGANGTFYRYLFPAGGWHEEYYYGILRPGLKIDKLINNSDTVFAVNGNRIIRSEDDGLTWSDDTLGTHNGNYRTIYSGTSNHYTLTDLLTGGTWI